jgi:hypothetical protein
VRWPSLTLDEPEPSSASAPAKGASASLAKISGSILKRYLELKADPSKAVIYEQALEVVAEALLDAQPEQDAKGLGLALMPMLIRGLQDEQTAPACVDLMKLIGATNAKDPDGTAPEPVTFGGARLHGQRIGAVPKGSVAAQMRLEEGDVIQQIDGHEADPAAFRAARRVIEQGGKLTLRVRRKEGETDTLEIEFERE